MTILNKNGEVDYKILRKMKKEEIIAYLSSLSPEEIIELSNNVKKDKEAFSFTTVFTSFAATTATALEANVIIEHVKNNSGKKDVENIVIAGLLVGALLYMTGTQVANLVLSSKFLKELREYFFINHPEFFKEEEKKEHTREAK